MPYTGEVIDLTDVPQLWAQLIEPPECLKPSIYRPDDTGYEITGCREIRLGHNLLALPTYAVGVVNGLMILARDKGSEALSSQKEIREALLAASGIEQFDGQSSFSVHVIRTIQMAERLAVTTRETPSIIDIKARRRNNRYRIHPSITLSDRRLPQAASRQTDAFAVQ